MVRKLTIDKLSILTKLVYRFFIISIEIPLNLTGEIDRMILKCIW